MCLCHDGHCGVVPDCNVCCDSVGQSWRGHTLTTRVDSLFRGNNWNRIYNPECFGKYVYCTTKLPKEVREKDSVLTGTYFGYSCPEPL